MTSTTLPTSLPTGTFAIETSHSQASSSVRHAGISKARGTVAITEGTIVVPEDLSTATVTATLDPATIDTRDANRDGHLRSADFFDVENHSAWTFTSTSVEASGEELLVHGDLTIRGTTRPVTLRTEFNGAATDPFGTARIGFSASTEISRKDFGLVWNAALESGGVLVGDEIRLTLDVEAAKQA